MTQLMLFDAATSITAPTVAFTPTVAVRNEQPKTTATFEEPKQGLNHMGDLARLVLMRYDMVARRRAERAEKARRTTLDSRL
ncbi:hypothetical protein Q31b_06450 [Novipirellula aureliae]|uniref:Uncharacterized protein n=1 Tax=Novipirellula aureliae TaxID=2527966 RepID=A0A5C6E748_9BACT|nr:hypothetical protein [Novipirellula aureliae]TWU45473.1 hypothetical protein Q31b_06450 [Novipirellula aureliae]